MCARARTARAYVHVAPTFGPSDFHSMARWCKDLFGLRRRKNGEYSGARRRDVIVLSVADKNVLTEATNLTDAPL